MADERGFRALNARALADLHAAVEHELVTAVRAGADRTDLDVFAGVLARIEQRQAQLAGRPSLERRAAIYPAGRTVPRRG